MAAPKKVIKGNLISIKDATLSTTTELKLEVDPAKLKSFATDDIYIELDLATENNYSIELPEIAGLGGFLNSNIYITDVSGLIKNAFKLTIKVADGSTDTIGGFTEIVITNRFGGMYITPLSATQWGTFYTNNQSSLEASVPVDAELPIFKPRP